VGAIFIIISFGSSSRPARSIHPETQLSVNAMHLLPSRSQAAQLLPPVLAAFLSCLFIVINPLASLSPPFSFLVLTIQILYFYPSGTLVAQIESSALAFAGAFIGLGYSNLFLYFAVLANRTVRGLSTTLDNDPGVAVDEQNRESVWARTACALGVAALFLASKLVLSSYRFSADHLLLQPAGSAQSLPV
jgi:hypothetical protein